MATTSLFLANGALAVWLGNHAMMNMTREQGMVFGPFLVVLPPAAIVAGVLGGWISASVLKVVVGPGIAGAVMLAGAVMSGGIAARRASNPPHRDDLIILPEGMLGMVAATGLVVLPIALATSLSKTLNPGLRTLRMTR